MGTPSKVKENAWEPVPEDKGWEPVPSQPPLDPNYKGPTLSARSGPSEGEALAGEMSASANAIPKRIIDEATPSPGVAGAIADKPDTEDADRAAALEDHPILKGLAHLLGSAPATATGAGIAAQNIAEEGHNPSIQGALTGAVPSVLHGVLPYINQLGGKGIAWLGSKLSAPYAAEDAARVASEAGRRSQAIGEMAGIHANYAERAAQGPTEAASEQWIGAGTDPRVQANAENVAGNLKPRLDRLQETIDTNAGTPRSPTLAGAKARAMSGMGAAITGSLGTALGGYLGGPTGGVIGAVTGSTIGAKVLNPETLALVGTFGEKLGNAIANSTPDPGGFAGMLTQAAKKGADSVAATHYAASQKPGYQEWLSKFTGEEDQSGQTK